MSSSEEFDSGWQKGVWDLCILTTHLNDTKYIMNGPIDYRYCINYGIITMEFFNCCSYSQHVTLSNQDNDNDGNIINVNKCIRERSKKIEIDTQYYWYQNNETWHFAKDFYPNFIEVYKYDHNESNIDNNNNNNDKKKAKEIYELALLMDSNRKYKKILSGPIIYEVFLKNVCFNELQPYIKGDINVLRKYGFCVKKIEANKFFSIFNEDTQYGIEFNFDTFNKVEFWNLYPQKAKNWEHYKSEQKEEKFDIVLITNKQKRIKYILYNAIMNCIEEIIKFTSFESYESGDHEMLNQIATKIKGFGIEQYKLWLDDEQNGGTSFIQLSLYQTVIYKNFVFPDKMKPFKAFFYRFPDLQSKYKWKQYKNHKNTAISPQYEVSLVVDDYENIHYLPRNEKMINEHFKMDSNLQIIHPGINDIDYDESISTTKDESIWKNMNVLDIDNMDDIDNRSQSQQQSIIHPLILSNTNSNITDYNNNNNNITLSPKSTTPKYHEMIINAAHNDNGWILTPKHKRMVFNPSNTNQSETTLTPKSVLSSNGGLPENKEIELNEMELNEKLLSPKTPKIAFMINHCYSSPKNLKVSPYFNGKVKLPPVNNNDDINNTIPEVWDFYISKYGFEPKNASQLHKFSKYSSDVNTLKYIDARHQFMRRKNK